MTLFFEDFVAGEVSTYGAFPVTKEAILAFARRYDPQPFHLDEAAAKASVLGGLSASGWHSAAMLMRMNFDAFIGRTASLGGPGVEAMEWLKPVRPGDVLHVRREILETRASRSRPGVGLVRCHFAVDNGRGEIVLTQRNWFMIARRGADVESLPLRPAETAEGPAETRGVSFAAYFEDVEIGASLRLGERRFDRAAIVDFASRYDPQVFHLDEEAARRGPFGRLAASGWHTAAQWMACAVEAGARAFAEAAVSGRPAPLPGPSPGYRDLKWLRPVFADDLVTYDTVVVDKRALKRPGWGIVNSRNRGFNQDGAQVFEFMGAVLCRMRG